jgi:hypothetical protein
LKAQKLALRAFNSVAGIIIFVFAALLAEPHVAALPQHPKKLQAQFEQESDAIRRAKLMTRISSEDFRQIRDFLSARDEGDALALLRQLRDDAKVCDSQLDARENNPEAHPAGFKQLQIAMRESLRRLDDLMPSLTYDEQPPFQFIREELDEINLRLIRQLFPRQPLLQEPLTKP